MCRILVTGSRYWSDKEVIRKAIDKAIDDLGEGQEVVIIEGACPYGGADKIASEYGNELGVKVESYPADFEGIGGYAGPLRNEKMVKTGADVCLAFPVSGSRGTWDCVKKARHAGIEVRIFEA